MRNRVRLISFTLAAMLAFLGFGLQQYFGRVYYERRLSNVYSAYLSQLNESLENISTELKKCRYFTDAAQLGVIANQLSVSAETAKNAVAGLPGADGELIEINRFLSQVGDYTKYIAKSAASGNGITEERLHELKSLSLAADELYSKVGELSVDYYGGFDSPETEFGSQILETEESLTDYPTLIYDGPFSDHMLTGTSKLLAESAEITRDEARKKAAAVIGIDEKLISDQGEQEGKISGYRFSAEDITIVITKNGGYPAYFRKYRSIGNGRLDAEQCVGRARAFLKKTVGSSFEESYYTLQDGLYIINFAYRNGVTVCYPDLIKIGVANDTGEVLFYEADGYLMNHKQRTIPTPKYTAEQASERLSSLLEMKSVKQALIPSDGGNEVFCYEFLCRTEDGGEALMYLNTATLAEERLFLVENTGNGSFTK